MGGQAATPLAKEILEGNPYVDGVVRYEGEEAMHSLAEGKSFEETPNLAYRKGSEIFIPLDKDIRHFPLRYAPIPDRGLPGVNLEKHIEIFQKDNNGIYPFDRITNAYTKRGCRKRLHGKGCSFCSRVDRNPSVYSAEKAWDEYHMLWEKYGIQCVFDYSDDFIYAGWLKQYSELCKERGNPGPELHVFGCVEDMTEENVQRLKEIGVTAILLGIESGDERVLRENGKKHSEKDILDAAERLGKAGIRLYEAYVLGLIGENEESIENTVRVSNEVRKRCQTEISYWNICQPLPGSRIWNMLMEVPELKEKFGHTYHLDLEELRREHIKRHTQISYEKLEAVQKERSESSRAFSREFKKEEEKEKPKIVDPFSEVRLK